MKKTEKFIKLLLLFLTISALLMGCVLGTLPDFSGNPSHGEVRYQDNTPKLCEQTLQNCFGENFVISEGVDREEHFFHEFENEQIVTHYTEWELFYTNATGQELKFVFTNRNGRMKSQEHMENSIESYFSNLVEQYYRENFWDKTISCISGCQKEDSAFYFKSYRLFSSPKLPETSVMFQERLHYSLTDHIYFPQLQMDQVFCQFPYILNMYLYVTYESRDPEAREKQRQETEARLGEMIDEMLLFTHQSLNATAHITMTDEKGYVDSFSLAVLNGEYFSKGPGTEFEIALHENFFGPIYPSAMESNRNVDRMICCTSPRVPNSCSGHSISIWNTWVSKPTKYVSTWTNCPSSSLV